ncbi:MAG: hypothetical protein B9S36_07790 [Verrucomicrobiia bacterium Tous-C2TDCM]|nr:MAG: hypothetical protein B9S36_07790 [Verrucomicrobiae bacterium Tous-C2TDCM]
MQRLEELSSLVGIHADWLAWVGGVSLATVLISAIAVPVLIRQMPPDYFMEDSAGSEWLRRQHRVLRVTFLFFKNLFGALLVVGGLIMFVTPGQGILTLGAGILLLNFPGKRRFEIWLVTREPVKRAIDWIRRRAGRPPLLLPGDQSKIG